MKRLILLRHAKSAWPQGVDDHERPLAARGLQAAPLMGAYLRNERLRPDLALVSTARRAQETWAIVSEGWQPLPEWRLERGIYEAAPRELADVVRAVPAGVDRLMLVGHNPGMAGLALGLAIGPGEVGRGEGGGLRRLSDKFPTAGLAVLDLAIDDWLALDAGTGMLERFITPAMLGGTDED